MTDKVFHHFVSRDRFFMDRKLPILLSSIMY